MPLLCCFFTHHSQHHHSKLATYFLQQHIDTTSKLLGTPNLQVRIYSIIYRVRSTVAIEKTNSISHCQSDDCDGLSIVCRYYLNKK